MNKRFYNTTENQPLLAKILILTFDIEMGLKLDFVEVNKFLFVPTLPGIWDWLPCAWGKQLQRELEEAWVDKPLRSILKAKFFVISIKLPNFVCLL